MNCNEAFEHLTDANLRNGNELRLHIDACPRCRQMQAVLEPALGLFDPPVLPPRPAAGSDPAPRGESAPAIPYLSPDAVQLAEDTARTLMEQKTGCGVHSRRKSAMGLMFAAAGLLLAAVAVYGFNLDTDGDASPLRSDPVIASECTWLNRSEASPKQPPKARGIVLSCVACHLADSPTARPMPAGDGLGQLVPQQRMIDAARQPKAILLAGPITPYFSLSFSNDPGLGC
jgi:hypothetical protein